MRLFGFGIPELVIITLVGLFILVGLIVLIVYLVSKNNKNK